MKAVAVLVVLALAGFANTACGADSNAGVADDSRQIKVVATIAPIGALAREVGGDLVSVTVLVGAGVDPHEYELKSDDRKAIEAAKVVLRNGVGLDDFLDKAISDDKGKVTTVTEGLTLRNEAGEEDPHVWQSIENDKAMVDAIVAALTRADAPNGAAYRANGDRYKETLDATEAEIRKLIDSIPKENRKMVTNHDAFGYFIERYGLTFVGAVIPNLTTQAEPSAKEIASLVETIKREKVKAIFAESSVDPKIAAQIAKDTGVRIVDDLYGDTLGEPGSGAETVDGMLLSNARKIAEALK